jgi:hypothetical protein
MPRLALGPSGGTVSDLRGERERWWRALGEPERDRWGPLLKAMTEAEREEFFLHRETRDFFHHRDSEAGIEERDAAERLYHLHWSQRLERR